MSPCSLCRRTGKKCIVAGTDSKRCSNCVRHRRTGCDYTEKLPSVSDWASIDARRSQLRKERNEAMAKVLRISKLEEALDDKEKKMVEMGLETLEELEEAEQEELRKQQAHVAALEEASASFNDPSFDPAGFADLPDSFFLGLPYSGQSLSSENTPGVSQGSGG